MLQCIVWFLHSLETSQLIAVMLLVLAGIFLCILGMYTLVEWYIINPAEEEYTRNLNEGKKHD